MGKFSPNRIKKAYRRGAALLAALLCFNTLAGCGILGDGEINIVTAPPIVEQEVVALNTYVGAKERFDIGGTEAFYLLPGIENHPDYLQDFMCLDYTTDGNFIYYYCGPSYISKEEVAKYKGTTGTAPDKDRYESFDRENVTPSCDAYILMSYNPETGAYKVFDAQGYEHITADKKKTGMEFYKSEDFGFYTLSHAYGCKISGTDHYFIFDQNSGANIYDKDGKCLASTLLGEILSVKVGEVAANIGAQNGSSSTSSLPSDASDEDKKDMEDAMEEISNLSGRSYSSGTSKASDIQLNCLVKSAVMDGSEIIYLTVMLYTGDSPWVSDVMYNRVISIYSLDLSSGYINFISENQNYEAQKLLYKKYGADIGPVNGVGMNDLKWLSLSIIKNASSVSGVNENALVAPDDFTPFSSDNEKFEAIIGGNCMITEQNYNWWQVRPLIEDLAIVLTGGEGKYFKFIPDFANIINRFFANHNWAEYALKLKEIGLLPVVGNFSWATKRNETTFRDKEGKTDRLLQVLEVIHVTDEFSTFQSEDKNLRVSIVNLFPSPYSNESFGDVYAVPYEYNEEPWYAYHWVQDQTKAERVLDDFINKYGNNQTLLDAINKKDVDTLEKLVKTYNAIVTLKHPQTYMDEIVDPEEITRALDMEVFVPDDSMTIPKGTIPKSYIIKFPKGATAQFAAMNNVEGSTTSSIREGVLLFSDMATANSDGTLTFKSRMTAIGEAGLARMMTPAVPGSAIDTGAYEVYDNSDNKIQSKSNSKSRKVETGSEIWLLITEAGVHFFPVERASQNMNGRNVLVYRSKFSGDMYAPNERLLSSAGFTLHTENELSHAAQNRPNQTGEDSEYSMDEEKLAQTLNSSRIGTIQSALSFTPLNDREILISAYDSGATILNVEDYEKEKYSVLRVKPGSYYQSFPDNDTGNYVIVGFDTEDYMYGSMDLARAKVYDFDYAAEKQEIFDKALKEYLDQLAIDYVRRQYRTRENEDGTRVIVEYSEDNSEEAVLEAGLFGTDTDLSAAVSTLKTEVEDPKEITHTQGIEDYLAAIREKVSIQQDAMKEILKLTGADKLGDKVKTDPYWVDLLSRIQNSSDLGNLKDMLCEIALNEDMLSTMTSADAQTYRELRKVINYEQEHEDKLKAIENGNSNTESDKGDSNVDRGYNDNVDFLKDENMDKTMNRMEARALVLEDIEEMYFTKNPLPPEYYYGPEGKDDNPAISVEKEDAAWEEYLEDLHSRINPDNLALSRVQVLEDMAALSYVGTEGLSDDQKRAMRREITENIDTAESIMDVEELIFKQRMKLGPYIKYYDDYVEFKKTAWENDYERIEQTKSAGWYKDIKKDLLENEEVKKLLLKKNFTWEEYIQAVVMAVTNRQLKEDTTGDQTTLDSALNSATYYAKLVEFICEGAGEVSLETKAEMLEELLRGMQTVNGAQGAEEAIIVVRMMLPAYSGYKGEFEKYLKTDYDTSAEKLDDYHRSSFYRALILSMQKSDAVQDYLKSSEMTWDNYMASLTGMAPDAGDPETAAKKIYGLYTEGGE